MSMRLVRTDIRTDELEAARSALSYVAGRTADEDIDAATNNVDQAIRAADEDGTYEERLEDGIDHADRAVDHIAECLERLQTLHAAGQLRATNATVVFVLMNLRTATDNIAEWLDWARRELADLD